MAQMAAMSSLSQRPQAVPTLEQAMAARLPQYEQMLAPDREATKANMLFDIAGAALNFASNRGPRGEALRGSPVSRLAGAFSNLPAAIQKRVNDIETTQRQLKLLALQAGEKDRDEIQQINTKLASEKRAVLNTILQADARFKAAERRGAGSPFGKGDWEMNVFNTPGLIERYAAGQTTPTENNLIASARASYTQPSYLPLLDPDSKLPTGKFTTVPGKELPPFMIDAERMRNSGNVPPGTQVTLDRKPDETTRGEPPPGEIIEAPAPLLSPGGETPTDAGTARASDRPADEPARLSREVAMTAPISLWGNRSRVSGPFAAVYAAVSQTPVLGDPFKDITLARSQAEIVAEEATEAFLKSAQNSVTEQRMVQGMLQIKPGAWKDPEAYGTHLIGLSTIINQVLDDYRKKSDTRPGTLGSTLSPEQRTQARAKVSTLERLLSYFDLPPAVYSEADMLNLPPGTTEVLINGIIPRDINSAALELAKGKR
jgi:hypothetical protein